MDERIQIGCPNCGTVLAVKRMPGIEGKSVTCPVCKKTSPFTSFRMKSAPSNDDGHTQYAGGAASDAGDGHTQYAGERGDANFPQSSPSAPSENYTLGRLCVIGTNQTYQLMFGRNVIGRKAEGSRANIQIPCFNKRMSRDHLVIEVKKVQGSGFVHYVSLNKERVNPTFIGNVPLEFGDRIVLKHNDIIKLPDMGIRFEIPDDEGTEL